MTPSLVRSLGCTVVESNCEPDGLFRGRPLEPRAENLSKLLTLVKQHDADLGVAHDGDADRTAYVDENGNYIAGDRILALICYYLLEDRPGNTSDTNYHQLRYRRRSSSCQSHGDSNTCRRACRNIEDEGDERAHRRRGERWANSERLELGRGRPIRCRTGFRNHGLARSKSSMEDAPHRYYGDAGDNDLFLNDNRGAFPFSLDILSLPNPTNFLDRGIAKFRERPISKSAAHGYGLRVGLARRFYSCERVTWIPRLSS